jgi:hypothetical protein
MCGEKALVNYNAAEAYLEFKKLFTGTHLSAEHV